MIQKTSFFESKKYEAALYFLLGCYALLLIFAPTEDSMWYMTYVWVYRSVIGCLVCDVALRALFDRPKSFRTEKGIWFVFDVLATGIAFVPGYEPLRALRVLRILSQWSETRGTITPLFMAVWNAKDVWCIIAVLMFVNTLIAFDAFSVSMSDLFGTIPSALLTSISLVLGDNFQSVYAEAFGIHFAVALVHASISVFTLLFIIALIVLRVFKSFE